MQWFKSYPENISPFIDIPDSTLAAQFYAAIDESPDTMAVVDHRRSVTYAAFGDEVLRLAHALRKQGIKKGDRVALMLPNSVEYVISYYACIVLGATLVQNNPQYTKQELYYQLNNTRAKALIIEDALYGHFEDVRHATTVQFVVVNGIHEQEQTLHALITSTSPLAERPVIAPNDIAVLQFTGGTTGVSKGVMLTHANLYANLVQTHAFLGVYARDEKQVLLNVLPLFHAYGMSVAMNYMVYLQSTLVLQRKFDVEETLQLIERYKVTMFPGTPTIYLAVNHFEHVEQYNLTSIHTCISGSAPLAVEVKKQFEAYTGAKVVDAYGLSETSPVVCSNPVNGVRKPGSIGIPLPNTTCKIMSFDGERECALNEPGELIVKGPQVTNGYWEMPEETAHALKDGWLYTGDVAYMDEDGYIFLVSRKKEVIISSGYNIYPRDVEEVIFNHPAVKEAVAIGIPHAYRGETVKVFVVLKDGYNATEQEIIAFCHGKLAKYKLPTVVEFRAELPRSTVGKILRRTLVEEEQKRTLLK